MQISLRLANVSPFYLSNLFMAKKYCTFVDSVICQNVFTNLISRRWNISKHR